MAGLLDVFDIVLDFATFGPAEADDPSHFTTVDKGYVVQRARRRRKSDHASLVVIESLIHPHKRGVPIELPRQGPRTRRAWLG